MWLWTSEKFDIWAQASRFLRPYPKWWLIKVTDENLLSCSVASSGADMSWLFSSFILFFSHWFYTLTSTSTPFLFWLGASFSAIDTSLSWLLPFQGHLVQIKDRFDRFDSSRLPVQKADSIVGFFYDILTLIKSERNCFKQDFFCFRLDFG